ncbi:MAG: 6-bladed beta-propeller [Candidatus Saccharicenans sp.]
MSLRGRTIFILALAILTTIILLILSKTPISRNKELNIFQDFSPIETESEQFVISQVTKLDFSRDRIFVFDQRQKKIFVFSESFSYLYSIGSPGQGPGELEDPVDFAVCSDKIVVLERFPKRLDLFTLSGEFLDRVNLEVPEEIAYSYPSAILLAPDSNYIIAYSLSAHLMDVYDAHGHYKNNLLKREVPIMVYRKNIGNESALGFYNQGKTMLHFNRLDGEFIEIYPDGLLGRRFRIQDDSLQKIARELKANLEKEARLSNIQTDILSFLLYTNFCVDERDNLYVVQLRPGKDSHSQKLWIFDPEQKCLSGPISLPGLEKVKSLYFWKGQFFMISDQEKIWVTKRRVR